MIVVNSIGGEDHWNWESQLKYNCMEYTLTLYRVHLTTVSSTPNHSIKYTSPLHQVHLITTGHGIINFSVDMDGLQS